MYFNYRLKGDDGIRPVRYADAVRSPAVSRPGRLEDLDLLATHEDGGVERRPPDVLESESHVVMHRGEVHQGHAGVERLCLRRHRAVDCQS